MKPIATWTKPNYGVDAPNVPRNMFIGGVACFLLGLFTPKTMHLGGNVDLDHSTFFWFSFWFFFYCGLFILYVKFGKFRHRDFMLTFHNWRGDEQVLDVGCGRGLLLAGAAKHLTTGHATGIDIWSNEDMGGNSEAATLKNLSLEGITDRCTLISQGAQNMPFADSSFDAIVSNLCLHNIYDRPTRMQALHEIVRVLKPGSIAIISDYKLTGEYATAFLDCGLTVERRWGSFFTTFPPLRVVIAKKPLQ
jgi:arsenite methyltransferase